MADLRPGIPPAVPACERAPGLLARIARTASKALGVPYAVIVLPDPSDRRSKVCYGPGADRLSELAPSVLDDDWAQRWLIGSDRDDVSGGGDGAAYPSYIALPIGEEAGLLFVVDVKERKFTNEERILAGEFAALAADEAEYMRDLHSLRNSEEQFRAVTENALDLVAIVDRDGTFTYLSHAASGILGIAPEQGVGRSLFSNVPKEDRPAFQEAFARGIKTDDVVDLEYRYLHPDGSLRHLRLRGRNLFRRNGVGGFLVNVRDATERFQFEDELRKSRDRAEEMSKLKSVFLTNMSHEIRTPLTTILGFAEILEDQVGEGEREFVRLIQHGGQRLLSTLMSILDLARLESSSFEIAPEPFDVAKKIFETCLILEPLAQQKGLYLRVDVPDEPVAVMQDISALERTLSNLVSNGLKFTDDGGVTVSVEVDEDHVLIHVADTGIGISSEFMPYLFEEFKQESEGLSRIHEGSGLGLPITKRLVELMKGEIMAESEKGRGSVFTVALPRNGEATHASDNGHAQNAAPRHKVLVVEDNADTRTLVNHLLRKNYDVVCASDGEEALAMAGETDFDVLLVDINLGKGKSGEDVLHDIKSLPGYDTTPIVAVTAYAMPGDRERFFAEGFDDYVSKPFSKQRLLEALEGVLQ